MRRHLIKQIAVLDDLLERSRKSWKTKSFSMLAPSKSLTSSIISDNDELPTTAWNLDHVKDEPPATSFPFDHELNNSKAYRRVILNRMRRESVRSSFKHRLDEIKATSPGLRGGFPMGQMSTIGTLNNAAPSVVSNMSDRFEPAASASNLRLPFADNERPERSSSSVPGRPENLENVVPNFSRRASYPRKSLNPWPRSDAEDTCQTAILEDSHPSSAESAPPGNVKKMFSERVLAFEAAIPQAEAPRLCKVSLFGSGAVGKSPLVLQVCDGRENSNDSANFSN